MSIHWFQFSHFHSFSSFRSNHFRHFNSFISIRSFQVIHFNSFAVNSFVSINQFISFIQFNSFVSIRSFQFNVIHSFQFLYFNSFVSFFPFIHFNSLMSIPSFQIIHVNASMSIPSFQFLHLTAFIAILSFQFIHIDLLWFIRFNSFTSITSISIPLFQFLHVISFILILSFPFIPFDSFLSIHSCQFTFLIHFNFLLSILSFQFIHDNSFVSIQTFQFLYFKSFMSLDSCQVINFMHFISFQCTSFQLTMNSYKPCSFFEISGPARAGHYLVLYGITMYNYVHYYLNVLRNYVEGHLSCNFLCFSWHCSNYICCVDMFTSCCWFPYLYPQINLKLLYLCLLGWSHSPKKCCWDLSKKQLMMSRKNWWNHIKFHFGRCIFCISLPMSMPFFVAVYSRLAWTVPGPPGTHCAGVQRGTHLDQEGHRLWGSQLGKAGLRRLRGARNMMDGAGVVMFPHRLICVGGSMHVVYRLYTSSTLATYPVC